jgi:hypothetical protein
MPPLYSVANGNSGTFRRCFQPVIMPFAASRVPPAPTITPTPPLQLLKRLVAATWFTCAYPGASTPAQLSHCSACTAERHSLCGTFCGMTRTQRRRRTGSACCLRRRPIGRDQGGDSRQAIAVRQRVRLLSHRCFRRSSLRCRYWAMVAAVDAFVEDGSDAAAPFAALLESTRPSAVVVDVAA